MAGKKENEMTTLQLAEKSVNEREAQIVNQINLEVSQISINTPETYDRGTVLLKEIKSTQKKLDELRKSWTKPLDESKKGIMNFFRPMMEILSSSESSVKSKILIFRQEQQRIRAEKEARLREQARKEQEKLERAAERKAQRLEENGKLEAAEEIRETVPEVSMPVLENEIPKAKGISTRDVWKFQIVNSDKVPDEYKMVDEKKVGAVVRATKGAIKIPGVKIWKEQTLASVSSI